MQTHGPLVAGLQSSPKSVPCSYLYDARGSDLYNQIVALPEYYPYRTEVQMLQEHMPSIIQQISTGSVLVELGCGSATKTRLILDALLTRDGPDACFYEGIDCSQEFLQQAKENLMEACPAMHPINLGTICALYLEGLKEARNRHPKQVLCVLWLGSSLGNLDPDEALSFFQDVLRTGGSDCQVLLCTDMWKDAGTLHAAYHDSQLVTERFIKNGLCSALGALEVPDLNHAQAWRYDVTVNAEQQQVEMWLVAPENLHIAVAGVNIQKGERVLMEVSRKFTQPRLRSLAFQSGWCWQAAWSSPLYSIQMLYAPGKAFKSCWADTDTLFAGLSDWSNHPITIRHPFCFYYGHLAAFAKLKMLPEVSAEPWDIMFSRGIDPDVSDPSQCHSHPDAPPQWPTKHEIMAYSDKVRGQIWEGLQGGGVRMHAMCLALEHERMHQETLGYMQAQQRRKGFETALSTAAPTGSKIPTAWGSDAANATFKHGASSNGHAANGRPMHINGACSNGHAANGCGESSGGHAVSSHMDILQQRMRLLQCPAGQAVLGVPLGGCTSAFVWDNEGPLQEPEEVGAFSAAMFPVSIGEFRTFTLEQNGYNRPELWKPEDFKQIKRTEQQHPATWTVVAGDVWVHSHTETKHWSEVANQPVWVSFAEAQAFCAAHNARLMNELEYMRLLDTSANLRKGPRWHMLRSGGWEWTSSDFAPLHGFQLMQEYPEYSADFFDGKHAVLKGSAPVTHPSLIRDSFRNFYQKQYPYMFAKFRCCKAVG